MLPNKKSILWKLRRRRKRYKLFILKKPHVYTNFSQCTPFIPNFIMFSSAWPKIFSQPQQEVHLWKKQWKFNFTHAIFYKFLANLMSVALVHTPLRAGKDRHEKWADHRWGPTYFQIYRKFCLISTKHWLLMHFFLNVLFYLWKKGNVKKIFFLAVLSHSFV